jgi:hypothetical protein
MMADEILVVFCDHTDLWWLKFLRRGFRHCFILLRFADIWISIDALAHKTEIVRIDLPDLINLKQWLETNGDIVIKCPISKAKEKPIGPSVFSCVESVKRIIGIRKPLIITPWQLYKFITTQNEKEIDNGKSYISS